MRDMIPCLVCSATKNGGHVMAIEFKGGGRLIALDGVPVETKVGRIEDKAVWPSEAATRTAPPARPSLDISPGSPGDRLLRQMKNSLRDIQASLDRLESMRAAKIIRRGQRLVALRLTLPMATGEW
jgi:hypothetical protein